MPDRFGFEHFGGYGTPQLRCIERGQRGAVWEWPLERREHHHLAHRSGVPDLAAEHEGQRGDGHSPRRCANPFCGKVFQPRRGTKAYCSGRCRVAAHRLRHAEEAR